MTQKIVFLLLFLTSFSAFSQEINMDNYKYIIVSNKFEFLKSSDQYQTSSLTKFLLKKKGFEVYLSNETLPKELQLGVKCSALKATVEDDSSLFTVKNRIVIRDCFGNVVYTSAFGRSKEKDYKKGYHEAIRDAYETMGGFEYSYKTPEKIKEAKEEAILVAAAKDNVVVKKEIVNAKPVEVLYAQPKDNGFQLVNKIPKVVFEILKTRKDDVFIIKGKDGTLYKNEDKWFAEYYENNKLIKTEYQIKF